MHTHFAALAAPEAMSLARRLDAHIEIVGDDWIYRGSLNHGGYPIIRTSTGVARAHRVAYEIAHGPIPAKHDVDHVWTRGCRSRACVRPDHLEAVTHRVNLARARAKRLALAAAAGVAAAGIVAGTALPAAAHHSNILGTAVCNTETGLFDIAWTVENWQPGNPLAVASSTPSIVPADTIIDTTAVFAQDGVTAGTYSLTVSATWKNGSRSMNTGKVTAAGECAKPTPTPTPTIPAPEPTQTATPTPKPTYPVPVHTQPPAIGVPARPTPAAPQVSVTPAPTASAAALPVGEEKPILAATGPEDEVALAWLTVGALAVIAVGLVFLNVRKRAQR